MPFITFSSMAERGPPQDLGLGLQGQVLGTWAGPRCRHSLPRVGPSPVRFGGSLVAGGTTGRGTTLVGDFEGSLVGLLWGLLLGLPRLGAEVGTLAGVRGTLGAQGPCQPALASSTLVRQPSVKQAPGLTRPPWSGKSRLGPRVPQEPRFLLLQAACA